MKTRREVPRRPSGRPLPKAWPERAGPVHVELIVVGRALLRGLVSEANAQHAAGLIAARGGVVHRITIVDDTEKAISTALRESLARNQNLVITTGGLGPAQDDRTLAGVANALGLPLEPSRHARDQVEEGYRRRSNSGLSRDAALNLVREKVCRVPLGSEVIPNSVGIAPGVLCRIPGGAVVLCVPGAPREARAVIDAALLLLKEIGFRGCLSRQEIEAPSPDESVLRPLIDRLSDEYPRVWISTRPVGVGKKDARVLVLLETVAPTQQEADEAVAHAVRRLLALAAGSK